MLRRMLITMSSIAIVAMTLIASTPAHAQPQDGAQGDWFVFTHAGLDALMPDERDAGLRRALKMLHHRMSELPAEMGDQQFPGPLLDVVLQMLMQPMSLRAGALPEVVPPFHAQLTVFADDADQAEQFAQALRGMLSMAAPLQFVPDETVPGLMAADADGAPLWQGATRIGEHDAIVLALNKVSAEPVPDVPVDLPEGVEPSMTMRVDLGAMRPLIEQAIAAAGPEGAAVRAQLEAAGLLGDQPMQVLMASGVTDTHAVTSLRVVNARPAMAAQQSIADQPLRERDLRLIPRDATLAELYKFNPKGITAWIDQMAAQLPPDAPDDPLGQIEQMIGMHPQRDLLDHLGQTAGSYMAASNGPGLFGGVAFVEVTDTQAVRNTLRTLTDFANQMAQQQANGYVRFARRTIGGGEMTVLTFPGLPVPLEISMAVTEGYLFAAMSPQSLLAAMNQATQSNSSILDNPTFVEAHGPHAVGAMQMSYLDAAALAPAGYAPVSMGMAALANFTRSPQDPRRDAGAIMPSYEELMHNVQPMLMISRLEGDDYATYWRSDRSALVNACAMVGAIGGVQGLAVAGIGAGLILPAVGKAQENAKSLASQSALRNVTVALHTYAVEHDDALPETADALIEAGYLLPEQLHTVFGPCWDGSPSVWIDFSLRSFEDAGDMSQRIIAYDRAMYEQMGQTAVAFADGHVELLAAWDFEMKIQEAPNAGVDFNTPF